MGLLERTSDRLLASGVEQSVDRYEMMRRAEADGVPVDDFSDESYVFLLSGWVAAATLWLARVLRPRVVR